jgi:hypothetical protein
MLDEQNMKAFLNKWSTGPSLAHLQRDASRHQPADDPFPLLAGMKGVITTGDFESGVVGKLCNALCAQLMGLFNNLPGRH